MEPVSEQGIRASFVNTSKGEAKRLHVPGDLADRPWDDLDFLGWRDPKAPQRGYLVAVVEETLRGIALRASAPGAGRRRKNMCSLCLTVHSGGVELLVASRAGRSGVDGNSVGTYICADLACSLYVRDKRRSGTPAMQETLGVDQRIARLRENLEAFVRRVIG